MKQSYVDYWKNHTPGAVGLSKIGRGRWNIVYSNGTSKPVSYVWNIVPSKWRTYWLYKRNVKPRITFKSILNG